MITLFLASLIFIGDVQINSLSTYPDSVASIISSQIGNEVIYDAGDVVEHGSMFEEQEYARYQQLFPNSIPVPGNHDWYDGLENWNWGTSVNVYDEGIHVVGFDTQQYWNTVALGNLRQNLNDGKNITILFMHHQVYSDNLRNGAISNSIRPYLLPIIEGTKTSLVICGHGHAYERHYSNGVTYLVIGGAGAPLDLVGDSETQIISSSEHHWVEIVVTRTGIHCVVHGLVPGQVIDVFDIATPVSSVSIPDVNYTIGGFVK